MVVATTLTDVFLIWNRFLRIGLLRRIACKRLDSVWSVYVGTGSRRTLIHLAMISRVLLIVVNLMVINMLLVNAKYFNNRSLVLYIITLQSSKLHGFGRILGLGVVHGAILISSSYPLPVIQLTTNSIQKNDY